ncbi:glycogen synthase GlgA [Gehongia tenuis]|uniref:Glycogen synthase n=1 Tax=Gehongia tenuis TaxID=2763655 RepID=A0A926D2N5_9FIRM|nr:glycogen synthase GlgA [Gehongia tenuis]MBC8530364.1 glycogen synthase GlgA [Gehongia tenuis]
MKVLFCASECVPFMKTGGLADVAGALPKELARQGVDVRVIVPLYATVADRKPFWTENMEHVCDFDVYLGWRQQYCGIEKVELDGVIYYLVDNRFYFARDYIYGYGYEELERFAFFCRAVLEAMPMIGFFPDIIHINDWQTGMIPALLKIQYAHRPGYSGMKALFTIHNLQYQGVFDRGAMVDMFSLPPEVMTFDKLEFNGGGSFMKGGLVYSDWISTVSPTYAQEIQYPFYGCGLDGMLRARNHELSGILNGIDLLDYDPLTDTVIKANYSAADPADKAKCKRALQKEMDLVMSKGKPLIGMVGRLTGQKGLDLVEYVLDEIMATGAELVILGQGEEGYRQMFEWAKERYPRRIATCYEMNEDLARKIYAGADMFLMPSKFEPCGLAQMLAMRYGAVPIVRETGGLKDSVPPFIESTKTGDGFTFNSYNAHDMLGAIQRAIDVFRRPEVWTEVVKNAMAADYGWERSAKTYISLYEDLLQD